MFLGGNPPFQPQVGVSNGLADNPGGVGGAASLPLGMTAIDKEFKHPTAYMWSVGVQREIPLSFILDVAYVGRRGLYLQRERDINQALPGTLQANPGVNIAALRPFKGYGVIRLAENAGYSKYEQPPGQRRSPLQERLPVRPRLHARPLGGQRQRQARRAVQQLRRFRLLGQLQLRPASRVQLLVHLRPAVLSRPERHRGQGAGRLAALGLDVHALGHTAVGHRIGRPRRHRRHLREPVESERRPQGQRQRGVLRGRRTATRTSGSIRTVFSRPAAGTFGNGPRFNIYTPGSTSGDIALFKNVSFGGTKMAQFRARSSTS